MGEKTLVRYFVTTLLAISGLLFSTGAAETPGRIGFTLSAQDLSRTSPPAAQRETDSAASNSRRVSPFAYGTAAAAHVVGIAAGYNNLTKQWGSPDGKFHFKDEADDGLAFNDEISHLFVSYKLFQGISSGYMHLGFTDRTAVLLGTIEAALVMTAVEIPVDAYNPTQGFGVTDLVADYAGIGLALWRNNNPRLADFDLKTSIKTISNQPGALLGSSAIEYDNYVYWLTYRYGFTLLGAGYSTCRRSNGDAQPQLFLGIGTTIPDLLRPISSKAADCLRPLELYFFNFNLRVL